MKILVYLLSIVLLVTMFSCKEDESNKPDTSITVTDIGGNDI